MRAGPFFGNAFCEKGPGVLRFWGRREHTLTHWVPVTVRPEGPVAENAHGERVRRRKGFAAVPVFRRAGTAQHRAV